jgi:hypothetical protein
MRDLDANRRCDSVSALWKPMRTRNRTHNRIHLRFAIAVQIAHKIAHDIARVISLQPGTTLLDFGDQMGTNVARRRSLQKCKLNCI